MYPARQKGYFALILFALLATGCSSHAPANSADAAASNESATGSAAGHIRLTGDFTMDRDFTVEQCAVSPPGDGLLGGYQMHAQEVEGAIQLLGVRLSDFSKDGTYSPPVKSQEARVGQAMANGSMGPLTLQLERPNSHVPISLAQMPGSKLDITITGKKGDAEFANLESPAMIEYMNSGASGTPPPHGKRVSGSITWDCGKIDHINGAMNNTVNGMFKKLTH